VDFFLILGFALAAYSVIANDAIQTLGTFLSSNEKRPWPILWAYIGSLCAFVLTYGWWKYSGDVSYGRLSAIPVAISQSWIYCIPPLVLLVLTRLGIPVSTTFLILTVFAPKALPSMLLKSILGYAVAFIVGIVIYRFVVDNVEKHYFGTKEKSPPTFWVPLQWCSTGFLWSQWLIQDLANIFVYLPRKVSLPMLLISLIWMLGIMALIFATRGGEIQKIVTSKTGTTDIRSATIIDFLFALILLVFKESSQMPMSTTWLFIGLLAGREIALTQVLRQRSIKETYDVVARDVFKAFTGLAISVVLAYAIPQLLHLTSAE
jgi:phosphate/sulfate permease